MKFILNNISDWLEVWALLIPLTILFFKRKQPAFNKPVIAYLWVALVLNVASDSLWKLRTELSITFQSNNYIYNLHSIIRFFLLSTFFIKLNQPFLPKTKRIIQLVFLIFVIVNFAFFQNFFDYWNLSSRLLSIEAAFLLFYCLQYYIYKMKEDEESKKKHPDFWIVTGLGIYVTINFFIFLLYNELSTRLLYFAIDLWNIHNITYLILTCL